MSTRHSDFSALLGLAACLIAALSGCGGGSDMPVTPQSTQTLPATQTPPAPPPCTPERHTLLMYSDDRPVTGEPRVMRAHLSCVGRNVEGAAIDWSVEGGGGTVNGAPTARTLTDADGMAEVTWNFGVSPAVQSLRARYDGVSPLLQKTAAHTLLAVGVNRCDVAGGTDLGPERVVSSDETWNRAGSPYYTRCPDGASGPSCGREVRVTNGATLTVEAGAAVCVEKLLVTDTGRLVAAGAAGEPVYFGVRSRAVHWTGLELQAPRAAAAMAGASLIRHAVIENATQVIAVGHPVVIEDTLVRRVAPASLPDRCTWFVIRQHGLAGIDPSRVQRTVIDGLGGIPWAWDSGELCPAVYVLLTPGGAPLHLSLRILNSRSMGLVLDYGSVEAATPGSVRLSDCEISGSLGAIDIENPSRLGSMPVVTSCNLFGNYGGGVLNAYGGRSLDVRGNWWGDPAGPGGAGEGISGNVDASDPLAAPVELDY